MPSVEPVGLHEVAELLGVSKTTAASYAERDDFPTELAYLAGSGSVWSRADVERWAMRTLPLPTGRPPKKRRK